VNLVGHIAAALAPGHADPSSGFLVGCMLPDLAAIARVRIVRPDGELRAGVAFHHACDAVFHESSWFRHVNPTLRDALLDAGVSTGAARACSHAGSEMLFDGALVDDERVDGAARRTLRALDDQADSLAALAPVEMRAVFAERLHLIGASLEPGRYHDPHFVAERLHRMTLGRRRIELRASDVDTVALVLGAFAPEIARAAPGVVADVRKAVPIRLRPA
jgi:hypothetical protein